MSRSTFGPHQGQPVHMAGAPLDQAQAALILVHGRGATADSILTLAHQLDQPGFAYLAPQAFGNTWYPYSFLAPLDQNEPALSSALMMLETLVDYLNGAGLPPEQTMLLGFSQGACLALEFVARHARRYGGLASLSGGLIGPDGTPRDYPGSLDGTPIFLGCSDNDPHIPQQRVHHSTKVLRQLGGQVTERLYPGLGHTVNEDELEQVQTIMAKLVDIKS